MKNDRRRLNELFHIHEHWMWYMLNKKPSDYSVEARYEHTKKLLMKNYAELQETIQCR